MTKKPYVRGSMDRVACLPFVGIDGAYLLVSGQKKQNEGERVWYPKTQQHKECAPVGYDYHVKTKPVISFVFDTGTTCAEWDGELGPIQIAHRCPEGWQSSGEDREKAEKHWFYEHAVWYGRWSQCAVDDNNLHALFAAGRFAEIFDVLREWAESNDDRHPCKV